MNLESSDAFRNLLKLFLVQWGIHECPWIIHVGSLDIIPYFVYINVRKQNVF